MNIYECDDTDIHKANVDIQIMNLYEYDDTDIHKVKDDIQCFIQRGEAMLNNAFHLSLNEDIILCPLLVLYNIISIVCHL